MLLFFASLSVFLLHNVPKKLFLVTQNGGQSPPSPPIATAMNMQSEKKFFYRNKGLYYFSNLD